MDAYIMMRVVRVACGPHRMVRLVRLAMRLWGGGILSRQLYVLDKTDTLAKVSHITSLLSPQLTRIHGYSTYTHAMVQTLNLVPMGVFFAVPVLLR
jgi:hypothetical protein